MHNERKSIATDHAAPTFTITGPLPEAPLTALLARTFRDALWDGERDAGRDTTKRTWGGDFAPRVVGVLDRAEADRVRSAIALVPREFALRVALVLEARARNRRDRLAEAIETLNASSEMIDALARGILQMPVEERTWALVRKLRDAGIDIALAEIVELALHSIIAGVAGDGLSIAID